VFNFRHNNKQAHTHIWPATMGSQTNEQERTNFAAVSSTSLDTRHNRRHKEEFLFAKKRTQEKRTPKLWFKIIFWLFSALFLVFWEMQWPAAKSGRSCVGVAANC